MAIARKIGSSLAICAAALGISWNTPSASAAGGAPYAYVFNQDDWTLSAIDTSTYGTVGKIQLLPNNAGIGVASPDGSKVYVVNSGFVTVTVIDAGTNTITNTISLSTGNPDAVVITPDSAKLYISDVQNSAIVVVSTVTGAVTKTISVPVGVQHMAITPDGGQLYTANSNNTATVIDTASDSIVATIQTGLIGGGIAVSPDGRRVYINGSGLTSDPGLGNEYQVAVIDAVARTLITKIASASLFDSNGVIVSGDGSRLYVPDREGTISIIATAVNSIVASFQPFTESVRNLAITPSGAFLYIVGQNLQTYHQVISVVDTNTNTTVAIIPGFSSSNGLSVFMGPPRGASTLSVNVAGNGSGQVTSAPSGISCAANCTASFPTANRVTLTAAPASGSAFEGWSGGGCTGIEPCTIALNADATVSANFVTKVPSTIALASAILPGSRSVQAGSPATVFGTIINAGPGIATNCFVAPTSSAYVNFGFQTTDPATNALTGTPNSVVDIPAGKSQSFVLAFTPTVTFSPNDMAITFACSNANPAPSYSGINTLLLSSSLTPPVDVIGLGVTATNDGILHIDKSRSGAFAVAAANVGSAGTVIALADTGPATLPLALTICRTDPFTGVCFAPPAQVVSFALNSDETATYSIFATATATIPFLPAANRIYVRFVDTAGVLRGSTSVAVQAQ